MQTIPWNQAVDRYVASITPAPEPSAPEYEPAIEALVTALPMLRPMRGEVVVLVGFVPLVRMLIAGVVVEGYRNQTVALDHSGYAGPGIDCLVRAIGGARTNELEDLERALGAAQALRERQLVLLASDVPIGAFPDRVDLAVMEADRFEGGLRAMAAHCASTGIAALAPHDEVEEPALVETCRTVRLHLTGRGVYPSGRRHVIASSD